MRLFVFCCSILISSCHQSTRLEPVTLVVGSWYGFYPFYYALEHRLDTQYGLRMKILEPTNISNLRRSYLRDQVDMAATSMVEFTNAVTLSRQQLIPVLLTDYSDGGDVIVARRAIQTVQELRGSRIAAPSGGVGEYLLSLVLENSVADIDFIQHRIPETECQQAFAKNEIDACVTYPPISTYLLNDPDLHILVGSESHPGRIFDLLWAKPSVSQATRQAVMDMWFSALEKIAHNPDAFYAFAARVANVSAASVRESMAGIHLPNRVEHDALLDSADRLAEDLVTVCHVAGKDGCGRFHQAFAWN